MQIGYSNHIPIIHVTEDSMNNNSCPIISSYCNVCIIKSLIHIHIPQNTENRVNSGFCSAEKTSDVVLKQQKKNKLLSTLEPSAAVQQCVSQNTMKSYFLCPAKVVQILILFQLQSHHIGELTVLSLPIEST